MEWSLECTPVESLRQALTRLWSLMLVGYTPEQDTLSGQLVNIKSIKVDDERETQIGSFMS